MTNFRGAAPGHEYFDRRLAPARNPTQFIARSNVHLTAAIFGILWTRRNPIEVTSVCYRGTGHEDKMQASIRFSANIPERFR
jgi:hypothetical protein